MHTHTRIHTPACTHRHTHAHIYTQTHAHTLSLCDTYIHILTHTYSHTLFLSFSLFLSISLSLTHTHTRERASFCCRIRVVAVACVSIAFVECDTSVTLACLERDSIARLYFVTSCCSCVCLYYVCRVWHTCDSCVPRVRLYCTPLLRTSCCSVVRQEFPIKKKITQRASERVSG